MAEDKPVAELSFEEAMRALESIVDRLEGGGVELEASIALYERGKVLREHCEKKLADAELRVSQIAPDAAGAAAGEAPLDIE